MHKLDFRARPQLRAEPSTFSGTTSKGESFEITLIPLNPLAKSAAQSYGEDLCTKYITGGYIDQMGDFAKHAEQLIAMNDGSPVDIDERTLITLAFIERMQSIKRGIHDPVVEGGYCVEDLAAMATNEPELFEEFKAFAVLLQRNPNAWLKKDSAVTTPPSPKQDSGADSKTQA